MKYGVIFTIILGMIASAYFTAQAKLAQKANLQNLHLNMSLQELEEQFGAPFAQNRNVLTYILEDSSQLFVTLRDELVTSAMVKFHKALKIEDPQLKQLTLVQMNPGDTVDANPSWFYAGKPEEGLIYKITQNGEIETLTWVPPFTYGNNQAKNLQALLMDFKNKHLSNL